MMGVVVADRWDLEDLASVAGLARFADARARLAARVAGGGELLDDVFLVLLKATPELVKRTAVALERERSVIELVLELDPVRVLRRSTVSDPFVSACAAGDLADVVAAILEQLDEVAGDDPDGALAGQALTAGGAVAAEAVEAVCEAVEGTERAGAAWGIERGSLRHLPVAERLALARSLDSDRVQRITDLFGRMRTAAFARPALIDDGWGEVVDLELGDDLARVLPAELLGLVEAGLEDVFLSRLANGELAQLETSDEDNLALGGIILCVDGSDSMHQSLQGYTREMWAQAFKLLLIRQAQRQGRALHVIDFGAHGEYRHTAFEGPGDFSPERILATAGAFFGAGTNFETPLRESVRIAAAHPAARADVVFVSDGQCWTDERFLARYKAKAAELGMRTWGVLVAARGELPFAGETWSIRDLTGGAEVSELLTSVA